MNSIIKEIIKDKVDSEKTKKSVINYIENLIKYDIINLKNKKGLSPQWLSKIEPYNPNNRLFPLKIAIELTDKCNLACSYCYRDAKIKGGYFLKHPIELLHNISFAGIPYVEITGGEPLLHPDIENILLYSLKNFQYVVLLTNGILLNDKIFGILNDNRNKIFLQISLPSLDRSRFKKITGFDMLNIVKANIKKAGSYDFYSRVTSVLIDEHSFLEVEEITNFVYTCGIKEYGPSLEVDVGRGEITNVSVETISRLSKTIEKINNKYNNIIKLVGHSDNTELVLEENKEGLNCGAGWRSYTLDPYGYSRPCSVFPLDFGSFAINNKEISQRMFQLEKPNKKTCDGCIYENHCRGCILKGWLMSQKMGYECRWVKENNVNELFKDWKNCKM